jgi:hypothetical protein
VTQPIRTCIPGANGPGLSNGTELCMERNAAVSSMPNPSRPTRDTGILLISEPPCSTIYGVSRMLLVTAAYGQGKTSRPAAARSRIVGVQDPARRGLERRAGCRFGCGGECWPKRMGRPAGRCAEAPQDVRSGSYSDYIEAMPAVSVTCLPKTEGHL